MGVSGFGARLATVHDAAAVARLLHDFNAEFDTPSPGVEVLTDRLRRLLDADRTFAVIAGEPTAGVALVTLRPNVWYDGKVAMLDELYVAPAHRNRGMGSALVRRLVDDAPARGIDAIEINVDEGDLDARRFYERHGFSPVDPDSGDRALYYALELT
jgi:GNAT superfamily N-acetyltransferase